MLRGNPVSGITMREQISSLSFYVAKKVRYTAILILVLIVYSLLGISFYHHHPADLNVNADCVLCEFTQNLSCADKTEPALLLVPTPVRIDVVFESVKRLYVTPVLVRDTRGPPIYCA